MQDLGTSFNDELPNDPREVLQLTGRSGVVTASDADFRSLHVERRGKLRRVFGLEAGAAELTLGRRLRMPPL